MWWRQQFGARTSPPAAVSVDAASLLTLLGFVGGFLHSLKSQHLLQRGSGQHAPSSSLSCLSLFTSFLWILSASGYERWRLRTGHGSQDWRHCRLHLQGQVGRRGVSPALRQGGVPWGEGSKAKRKVIAGTKRWHFWWPLILNENVIKRHMRFFLWLQALPTVYTTQRSARKRPVHNKKLYVYDVIKYRLCFRASTIISLAPH